MMDVTKDGAEEHEGRRFGATRSDGAVNVDTFEQQRGQLFGLAYRLLGSATDAEDVLQEASIRWIRADTTSVAVPAAWLTRVVTNLSLNLFASAARRREHYVGTWLPEPVLTSGGLLGPLDRPNNATPYRWPC